MDFHQGHVFYIVGLVFTLLGSIVFLLYKNLDYIIEGIYKENPAKLRKVFGIIGLILFAFGLIDLFLNWDRVSQWGMISF